MPRPTVELVDVECIKGTDAAILVLVDDAKVWIPRSQVDPSGEVQDEGDHGTLVVTEWIAVEKGLV